MNIPLNVDWQQILLHLFNLVLLFAIMYFLLYKPIKDFMAKRMQYYKDMDDNAEKNLADSEEMKASYEEKIKGADDEIAAKMAEAVNDANKSKENIIANAKAEGDQIVATAKKKAKDEHDRMLSETKKEITDLISEAATKIVNGEADADGFDSFLDAAENK